MKTVKIFIADDSVQIQRSLTKILSYEDDVEIIGESEDVETSISRIRQLQPQVVILDIRMPGGNGFDVLHKITDIKPKPTIIMLTNYASKQYREKALKGGADYFFDKSAEFDRVLDVIQKIK